MFTEKPALYIHIPFCVSKCSYCDFYSVPKKSVPQSYIDNLISEIKEKFLFYEISELHSVYFGGGTPSLLSVSQVESLMSLIRPFVKPETEVSFELNCDDVSVEYLSGLFNCGINRFSVGIQSFNHETLTCINRRASREISLQSLKILSDFSKENGIRISVDFIAGLPFSDENQLISDLKTVIEAGIKHISLYSLTLEENTPLFKAIESGKLNYDESKSDEIWIKARDYLIENGFCQYEVSNFCIPGNESRHNSFYWESLDYIGCGSGATGTIYSSDGKTGTRFTNKTDIESYSNGKNEVLKEELDEKTVCFEYLMTAFRTVSGVDERDFYNRFGKNLTEFLPDDFSDMIENGLLIKKEHRFSLSTEGMLFLNKFLVNILEKFD